MTGRPRLVLAAAFVGALSAPAAAQDALSAPAAAQDALSAPAAAQDALEERPPTERISRVAIVPFANITGAAIDGWIGVGIAETLSAELPPEAFEVIAHEFLANAIRNMDLADDVSPGDVAVLALGRQVGARWVVSGGYQRVGDQIRITAWLVEVSTGAVVRSAKVDGAVADLFALQDRIAKALVTGAVQNVADATARPDPTVAVPGPDDGAIGSALAPATRSRMASPPPAVLAPPAPGSPSPESGEPGDVAEIPSTPSSGGAALLGVIDGPPPPIAPEVMTRDAEGRTTVRAIKLTRGLRLDGQLDEEVYHSVPPITDLLQQVPDEGSLATEKTEAWIMFDQNNLYFAARVWDSAPPSEWVANEMRRDSRALFQNDTFGMSFDTFYDRRNAFFFYTNALGGMTDQRVRSDGNNIDWNTVWDARTGRFEGGWTQEVAIPFKSLRYRSGPNQVWGVQFRRVMRKKNEYAHLTPVPVSMGRGAVHHLASAGTLVGMEVPDGGVNLEFKPYGIGGVTTNLREDPPVRNDGDGDAGFDVKYGITQSVTADLTYNTDFAQVEVDEQQVNLTRFSLFFPEKREFFLEGQGIFNFGRGGFGGGGGRGGETPTVFFSRQIGLQDGEVVPIIAGGRVTGKMGVFDVGALSIQTDDEPISGAVPTNFTAVRVKRDILRRSSIGGIFTNRSVSLVGDGANQAYGVDGIFSFYDNVEFLTYFAKTRTPGIADRDKSYQGRFRYNGDRYGVTADHLVVEDDFIPEVGFVRRDNFKRTNVLGRFSPRPQSIESVRQFTFEGRIDYFVTADTGLLETRRRVARFSTELENSDLIGIDFTNTFERLDEPFDIAPDVTIPVGGYGFSDVRLSYLLGQQRRVSGSFSFQTGEFWSGDITSAAYSRGRITVLDQFSIEPSVSANWVDLPEGSFTTTLVQSRFNYTFTPRMFFSGLLQYNSSGNSLSSNLRLRWEYTPGSELFILPRTAIPTPCFRTVSRSFAIRGLSSRSIGSSGSGGASAINCWRPVLNLPTC